MVACDGFTTRGGTTAGESYAESHPHAQALSRLRDSSSIRLGSDQPNRTSHGCGRFPTHETPAVGVGSWLVESHESACPRYTALCWRGDAALACEPQPPVAPGRRVRWSSPQHVPSSIACRYARLAAPLR